MNSAIILAIIGIVLIIAGIVLGKLGSNKGYSGLVVVGFLLGFVGVICGYCGYDNYMSTDTVYTISQYEKIEDGYRITLSSDIKGFTGGKIIITDNEAVSLKLVVLDSETGNYVWSGSTITEDRKWVNDHRNSTT